MELLRWCFSPHTSNRLMVWVPYKEDHWLSEWQMIPCSSIVLNTYLANCNLSGRIWCACAWRGGPFVGMNSSTTCFRVGLENEGIVTSGSWPATWQTYHLLEAFMSVVEYPVGLYASCMCLYCYHWRQLAWFLGGRDPYFSSRVN